MAKAKIKKPVKLRKLPLPELNHQPVEWLPYPREGPQEPPGLQINSTPSPTKGEVVIIEPDPLDERLGLIYIIAGQRMLAFAREYPQEVSSESFVRMILARVAGKDPTVKLMVAVNVGTGEVLGHGVAMIEGNGQDRWVFGYQLKVDVPGTNIVGQMLQYATPWGKQHGATHLLMATQLEPEFWAKYNFESVRTVMKRAI